MKPILGIDIGNARIKIFSLPPAGAAEAAGGRPSLVSGEATRVVTTADAAALWRALPEGASAARIHLVAVRPELADEFTAIAESAGAEVRRWTAAEIPMPHPYAEARRLGPDRLLAAFAAHHLHGGPLVVVDAGTALTVDLVDASGRFAGGAIAPGLSLLCASLGQGAMLENARVGEGLVYPGRSTEEALAAGALAALVGATRELVRRAGEACREEEPRVVVTGGDGPRILREVGDLQETWIAEPRLIEIGLALLERVG